MVMQDASEGGGSGARDTPYEDAAHRAAALMRS
jgi:hypothetical protein